MRKGMWIIFLAWLFLLLASCGGSIFEELEDRDTDEARQLEIAKLLDEGDYDAVLAYPGVSPLNYAAAAMGKAGLDTTSLLNSLIDMAQSSDTDDLSPVTQFFPLNPDAQPYLDEAKNRLASALAQDPADYDLNFQMTILSITDVVVEIADAMEDYGVGNPRDGISVQEAADLGAAIFSDASNIDVSRISADIIGTVFDYLPDAGLGSGSELNTTISSVADTIRGFDGNPGDVSADDVATYLVIVLGQ